MEIIEPALGEGKILLSGKVVLSGFIETRFKLIDGKWGPWLTIGTNIKNESGEWKNGCFTLKNDAYKAASEAVEEKYRELVGERGAEIEKHSGGQQFESKTLEEQSPSLKKTLDDLEVKFPPATVDVSEIPF